MSRHHWYTISGTASRLAELAALRWQESDLFPAFVFAYGIIEIFGFYKSVKIINKIRRKHARTNGKQKQENSNVSRV
jgi:hypothetical protein